MSRIDTCTHGACMHSITQNYGIHKLEEASRIVQIASWVQIQIQSL